MFICSARAVSLPVGAIEACLEKILPLGADVVSIPVGAIEAFQYKGKTYTIKGFQFQWVRLRLQRLVDLGTEFERFNSSGCD